MVGGANNPTIPSETALLARRVDDKKVEIVTIFDEYDPWHWTVLLDISAVSP